MSMRFEGKVAIVTGAGCAGPGWGNGRAIAVRLAEEGARVFAIDREPVSLDETLRCAGNAAPRMHPAIADVTDSSAVAAMMNACIELWGRIDVLVNNVGGSAAGGPVEMSEEVWDAQVDLNLKSVFLGCTSTSGLRWTGSAQVAYAATKAAVIQLTRVVAVQYASRGIRANTVVPGQLHTPMVEARLAHQRAGGDVQALLVARQKRIPMAFMGDGRDTAAAAAFLASDEARFITGTELVVDGGMTARCD